MGLLNFFGKSSQPTLVRLPTGSFTVDRNGKIVASTLPISFPQDQVRDIASTVLDTFRNAQLSKVVLTELIVEYAALKLTARELRGGAIIFLAPRTR